MIGQVHYAQAPFGVFYVVASWVRADNDPAERTDR